MDRNEAASVIQRFLTCRDICRDDCYGHCETCRYNTEYDETTEALKLAIKAFDKDIDVPTKSALDHIHNVVRDDAYKRGYEQGKAEKVPAITLEWIGEYLAWLKGIGGYGLSDARAIQSMIIKWKMEHPQSGCGPDSCKIGG